MLFAATSASALSGVALTVKPRNADVLANCSWKVTSVNPSTVQVQGRLSAQAQPATLLGYGTNAYTQVACYLYDQNFNQLKVFAPFANSASLPTTSITPVVPYSPSYHLCGQAFVKKNNGATSLTPVVCA
jgi:hypothetical protein